MDDSQGAAAMPADRQPDLLAATVDQWVRDVFHGSRLGRELSDQSQAEILAAKDALIGKLRALK